LNYFYISGKALKCNQAINFILKQDSEAEKVNATNKKIMVSHLLLIQAFKNNSLKSFLLCHKKNEY